MRRGSTLFVLLALSASSASAWNGATHEKMVDEALPKGSWVDQDQYLKLRPTSFAKMVDEVFGIKPEAGPRDFRFFTAKTRKKKSAQYRAETASISDPNLRTFARKLLLSKEVSMPFEIGEGAGTVSARQILATYSKQPDDGMDMVDSSWHKVLMGGNNPKDRASQGNRHMRFAAGLLGEAPKRAELFFKWGRRAIEAGHEYWGFRMVAWGLHYVQDMGMPWHTKAMPLLRLLLTGLKGAKPSKEALKKAVKATSNLVAGNHYRKELWDQIEYLAQGENGQSFSKALADCSKDKKARRTSIKKLSSRLALSSMSTTAIARAGLTFFGAESLDPRRLSKEENLQSVQHARKQQRTREIRRAEEIMVRRTRHEFWRTGVAIRRAIGLLGKQLR